MRQKTLFNIIFLLLLLASAIHPARAGLLTRGNIYAESLAGCSIGGVASLAWNAMLPAATAPAAGTLAITRVGILGGCLAGATAAITLNGIYLYNKYILNSDQSLETLNPMIYPETPAAD